MKIVFHCTRISMCMQPLITLFLRTVPSNFVCAFYDFVSFLKKKISQISNHLLFMSRLWYCIRKILRRICVCVFFYRNKKNKNIYVIYSITRKIIFAAGTTCINFSNRCYLSQFPVHFYMI